MKLPHFLILSVPIFFSPGIYAQHSAWRLTSVSPPDSVITWKFDSQGDSSLNSRTNYRYDSRLNLIESEKFTREQSLNLWVPQRKVFWEFDNQDRRTLWAIYDWDQEISSYKGFMKDTYQYDQHGNTVAYHYYTWNTAGSDWGNCRWDAYFYDEEGKITRGDHLQWNTSTGQWDTASYDIYEYDGDNVLQHLTTWEPDEDVGGKIYPCDRIDYQYDVSDNLTECIWQVYNPNTQFWYLTVKQHYWYDAHNRKVNTLYSEYIESEERWIEKEKEEWGWGDNDSLTLYAYYRMGDDLVTWFPSLKTELSYNSQGKMVLYRGFSGDDLGQWVPTYERRYSYQGGTWLEADSLFQWFPDDAEWVFVDCHHYRFNSQHQVITDSYYKLVVHTGLYELSTRSYYFYSENTKIDEAVKDGLNLYPNPTTGKFQIANRICHLAEPTTYQSHIQSIEIVDLFGKIIKPNNNRTIEQSDNGTIEHDISNFPPGIYFIRIEVENQTIVKKIIKL